MNRLLATLVSAFVALAAAASAAAHSSAPLEIEASSAQASAPPTAPAEGCRSSADPESFATVDDLLAANQTMARFGRRPTGSPAHERFVDWVERRSRELPGADVSSLPYGIDRWLERSSSLSAGPDAQSLDAVRDAGAVPYSKPTGTAGAGGTLVFIPHGESIADHDVRGKIVIRDAVPGKIPRAAFLALAWFLWDPDASFTPETHEDYERDYIAYMERVDDLRGAAEAGAAGLLFVHGFPHEQVEGQYAPYEGERWGVPALYVGVDEGERLKQLADQGGSARIDLSASEGPAETRTVVATLPGMSNERIVVESHTDGMNAIWDNGPIAMLAVARHFATLPRECRPRTIQFVFTTAHLYQQLEPPTRDGGAEQYAQQLDQDYERGTVALVVAMEHMGAREYDAFPREGGPGRVLNQTGRSEPTGIFVGESPVLVEETSRQIVDHDLRRSIVLRGADLPGARIPPHHSFGGEGTPYHKHLIPTVGLVTGPWSLYNPAFGMEAIDGDLLHKQTLTFTDLVHAVATIPREALAGGYLVERQLRSGLCMLSPDGLGAAECQSGG